MLSRPVLMVALLLVFAAAAKSSAADVVATDAERLQASLAKWEKARDDVGGNYTYQVVQVFFNSRTITTITVREGKVVERKFDAKISGVPVKPGEPEDKPRWIETGKEIGTHAQEGAPARTIDELYAEALKLVGTAVPEHHKRYLAFDKQGFLGHCFQLDTRIADDSPTTGVLPIQIQLPKK